ncbi:MAG TPA: DNA polymerase III subunit beta [Candidatus Limnocylindria bacterium]|nr:DNA polymerase III subunit beta [Candidatus Limnocylindria bacterium]
MRIRVERDTLAEAVTWTARSLPARPPVPVLAGLLIEAASDHLTLSSFDYEVSGRVAVDAVVEEAGTVLVSGRLLAEITRALPARPVTLTTEGSKVLLVCGTSTFSLPTLPVEEYPTLPEMPVQTGSLSGASFAAAVAQVAVAAGRDDTLPVLTGIRMEIEGDTLTLAATDRYRLAVREIAWTPEAPGGEAVALVPARTLADTAKSLAVSEAVSLALASGGVGEGLLGIEGGGRRTTTRLLDGEFPKYRSLLPAESLAVATIDTAAFVEAVKRVSLVAERNTPVRLSFTAGEVQLDAGTGDDAQASETLESSMTGDPITIAFNPHFLLDGLGAIDAPVAALSFTTSTKPAVLTGRAADGAVSGSDSYRYLLMPVRLSG